MSAAAVTIHRDLRPFTYLQCVDCCSVHDMPYSNSEYECEECYSTEPYRSGMDVLFDQRAFISHIRRETQSNSLRLMSRYMRWRNATDEQIYDRDQLVAYYDDLCSNSVEKQFFQAFPSPFY